MDTTLIIATDEKVYYPLIEDGIKWETERSGAPGKLTFTVINDGQLSFQEGDEVRLLVDGEGVFLGNVFRKKRDKAQHITVTAYDQLRYLKNKDTYVYTNKTAGELIQMLAADFKLNLGTIAETEFKIASRVEDNASLFDMIGNALDLTLTNKKTMYVLFDDYGKLTLKPLDSMRLNLLIDEETGENFDYSSTIDEQTYNKVKLSYENENTGKREIYIAQDSSKINSWGVLQYFDTLSKGENGKAKADALLSMYNTKTRSLKITNAFGDVRCRAGSMPVVMLNLGDMAVQNFMLVEKCCHTFRENEHFMDLTLRGGEFSV